MPSEHTAAAKFLGHKEEEGHDASGKVKFSIFDMDTWSRKQLGRVRKVTLGIAIIWLAFCTFFIFVWAVIARDNQMIMMIVANLAIRFSFGEALTNPVGTNVTTRG